MTKTPILALLALCAAPAAAQGVPSPPQATFDLAAEIADGPAMTASQAADRAVASAPSLARARALSRAAEASVARARAATLPRLEVSATYQHVDGFEDGSIDIGSDPAAIEAARALASSVSDPAARTLWLGQIESQSGGSGVSIPVPRDRVGFSARLTWPVSDLFFAVLPAIDTAEAGVRAREHEEAVTTAGVRRSAVEAYYTLVRARGAAAVAREAQRQAEAAAAQVEAAVRAGYLTRADRLAADARVADIARGVASAEAGVEIADAALRMLMGDDPGPAYGVALGDVEVTDVTAESALAARPELLALHEALTAQRAAARVEDSRGYPHLALYAGADVANPNRYQIPPQQVFTPSWEVGAMLTYSPNDTLGAVHRGDELGAQQAATEAQIEQLERGVGLEVTQAHAQLRAARRSVEAARITEETAHEAYESRLAQLRAGGATTADLFAAEGMLDHARLETLDAEVQLRVAAAHLAYAGGVL